MARPPDHGLPTQLLIEELQVWLDELKAPLVGREAVLPRLLLEMRDARGVLLAVAGGAPGAREMAVSLLGRWGAEGPAPGPGDDEVTPVTTPRGGR